MVFDFSLSRSVCWGGSVLWVLRLPTVGETWRLLLFGSEQSNGIWQQLEKDLPVVLKYGSISLVDRVYRGDKLGVIATFPHPLNPQRYAAVHGGTTPDAICWGSHLDMQLLPDFLVYDGGEVLD